MAVGVLIAHVVDLLGEALFDGVVSEEPGLDALEAAKQALTDVNVPVEAVSRPGLGHGIDDDGIARAAAMLARAFGAG